MWQDRVKVIDQLGLCEPLAKAANRAAAYKASGYWSDLAREVLIGGPPHLGVQCQPLLDAIRLATAAARVVDDIQDRDSADALWQEIGVARAFNVGVTLLLAGQHRLIDLVHSDFAPDAALEIQKSYLEVGLELCNGQHLDLEISRPTLAQYFAVARAKTGSWSAWCCETAALLSRASSLSAYRELGLQIGVLHQIYNDLCAINEWGNHAGSHRLRENILPIVYAFNVAPNETSAVFADWKENPMGEEYRLQFMRHLLDLGFAEYVMLTVEGHLHLAEQALGTIPGPDAQVDAFQARLLRFRATLREPQGVISP